MRPVLKVYAFHLPRTAASARDTGLANPVQLLKSSLMKSGWADADQQSYLRYDRGKSVDCEAMMTTGAFVYVDWATPDGMRYVGVAAPGPAPGRDRSNSDLCQVLDSLTTLYPVAEPQRKGGGRSHADMRGAAASSSRAKEP